MPYKRSKDEVEQVLEEHGYPRQTSGSAIQHTIVSIYSASTVVSPPELVARGAWAPSGDRFAGEQLLLDYRADNSRLGFQLGIGRSYEPDAVLSSRHTDVEEDLRDAVELPRPEPIKVGLTAAVTGRRSSRGFSGKPVELAGLASILFHCQGVSGELPDGEPAAARGVSKLRNAPSGGLGPVSVFVHAFAVEGLTPGTYEFLPHSNALVLVIEQPLAETLRSPELETARSAFALTFVYNLYHDSRKYGDSGVVFGLIEAGAILQNMHLARTALGLAGCDQGSYDKQTLERRLGLDGHTRHVVHVTVVGQEE